MLGGEIMNSFYNENELKEFGFKHIGKNVLISRFSRIYTPEKISIGSNVRIDDFSFLLGEINIGNNIHIAPFCLLMGAYGIEMEDFSGLSSRVSIYSATDDYSGKFLTNPTIPNQYKNVTGGKVLLGKHVIIGTGTTILPNLKIGEGSSVGANSLVTKSLDNWGIYFGNPVKKLKSRSRDLENLEKQYLESVNE